MEKQQITVSGSFRAGWQFFKKNRAFLVGVTCILLFIALLPGILNDIFIEATEALGAETRRLLRDSVVMVSMLLNAITTLGAVLISFALFDRKRCKMSLMFSPLHLAASYLKLYIIGLLYVNVLALGLFIFYAVVPVAQKNWIIWLLVFVLLVTHAIPLTRISFYDYIIAEYETGPVDALRYSWRLTEGAVMQLILFGIAASIFNVVGLMLLGGGLLVTMPVTMMARTHLYRSLQANRAV